MAIKSATMRIALANAYAAAATRGAIYTTTPGASAGTEVTGGSPAYARKALTWSAPSDNGTTATITATAVFDVPTGVTVVGGGVHSAITGGNYLDGATVTSQGFSAQGTYTLTYTYTQS